MHRALSLLPRNKKSLSSGVSHWTQKFISLPAWHWACLWLYAWCPWIGGPLKWKPWIQQQVGVGCQRHCKVQDVMSKQHRASWRWMSAAWKGERHKLNKAWRAGVRCQRHWRVRDTNWLQHDELALDVSGIEGWETQIEYSMMSWRWLSAALKGDQYANLISMVSWRWMSAALQGERD